MSGWRVYGLNNSSSQGSQVSCKVKIEGLDITKKYKMGKFSRTTTTLLRKILPILLWI